MKLSATRDSLDYSDARMLLSTLSEDKELVWKQVAPYLDPGQEEWKRQNFDALWKELHGRS